MVFWIELIAAALFGAIACWLVLRAQASYRERDYSGLKHHAKVHAFRFSTLIVAWALLIAAFIFHPSFIAQSLRSSSHGIEALADALPGQISSYVEIGMRELGGLLWFQVTAVIVLVRIACSLVATGWRALAK